jgi:hypothetical protein
MPTTTHPAATEQNNTSCSAGFAQQPNAGSVVLLLQLQLLLVRLLQLLNIIV